MKRLSLISTILFGIFLAYSASAQETFTDTPLFGEKLAAKMQRLSGWFADRIGFNPISLPGIIAMVIFMIFSILAVLFIGLVFYGGYKWMMARGNEQQVDDARGIIRHAIIGLIVLLASFSLGYFILYFLVSGGGGAGRPVGPY